MRIPRDLSGRSVAHALSTQLDYRVVHEKGSHIVLETNEPAHQRIAIPDHKSLRLGTLSAIIRAIANHKHLSKDEVIGIVSRRH